MSDPITDPNIQFLPGELVELEAPVAVGWIVHEVVGKPAATNTRSLWAWCKVSTEGPGYTEIVFTETDGQTIVDPYPKPTPDSPDFPVRLGPVVFKVFC